MKGYRQVGDMKFEVKKDGNRWFVTSENDGELKCSGRTLLEAIRNIPEAIERLEKRRGRVGQATKHHDHLWSICKLLPEDYEPYGKVKKGGSDCSDGCVYFYKLETKSKEKLYMDWGVCTHIASHRCGLLTFEHQGCPHAVLELNKRVYGTNPYASEPIDPEDEPDQQIPTHQTE